MPLHHALEVLNLAPTLDRGALKRAYFAELAKHPPHSDPEGFRRLRVAYEALCAPGGLERAFATAPLDAAAFLASYRARFDEPLAKAETTAFDALAQSERVQAFVDRWSRLTWDEAVTASTSALAPATTDP